MSHYCILGVSLLQKSKEGENMASSSTSVTKSRSLTKCVVVWEWFNECGKWRPYSPEVVAYIDKEGQVASQVHLGTVSACLNMYTIDLPSMCQIRKGTGS